ncbi:MAG: type II methionyl aminopeptidase [Candidatus Thermoplasmatota archaeon]
MTEIEMYRAACRAAAAARDHGAALIKPGMSLLELAEEVEALIVRKGAKPAFPTNISMNDVAAHFTPLSSEKGRFSNGMLVKLDVGAHVNGRIGDTAVTVEVGTKRWGSLIAASTQALSAAAELLRPGLEMRYVGAAVERTITSFGYKPISNLTGHSMTPYELHSGINVPNVLDDNRQTIAPGEIVAVEPFATNGLGRVKSHKNSGIYRLVRPPLEKEIAQFPLLMEIQREFRTLPFAERWCARMESHAQRILSKLVRRGIITYYPILMEAGGGMVSQAEHTLQITEKGAAVLT